MLQRKKINTIGGLAFHSDSLRYVELRAEKEGFSLLRDAFIPLDKNCIVRESVQNWELLEDSIAELKEELGGRFAYPVVMGLPSRDVMMRLLNYRSTSLEKAQETLSNDFSNHFPYSQNEAVVSLNEIEVPLATPVDINIMVAATRRDYSDNMQDIAKKMGLPVEGLEPMNVAFFRTIVGPEPHYLDNRVYFAISIESDISNIILGWRDNGILYRFSIAELKDVNLSLDALKVIVEDIQRTTVFTRNQYKGLQIEKLLLGGGLAQNDQVKTVLADSTKLSIDTPDIWLDWDIKYKFAPVAGLETAVGLALQKLLRP